MKGRIAKTVPAADRCSLLIAKGGQIAHPLTFDRLFRGLDPAEALPAVGPWRQLTIFARSQRKRVSGQR
jgi:hypothetical protein